MVDRVDDRQLGLVVEILSQLKCWPKEVHQLLLQSLHQSIHLSFSIHLA